MGTHSLKIMALRERNVALGHKLTGTGKAHSQLQFINSAICICNPFHQKLLLYKYTFYNSSLPQQIDFCDKKFPLLF